jgi:hypothetical protein
VSDLPCEALDIALSALLGQFPKRKVSDTRTDLSHLNPARAWAILTKSDTCDELGVSRAENDPFFARVL